MEGQVATHAGADGVIVDAIDRGARDFRAAIARALGQRTAHPSRLAQVAQEVVTLLGEGSLSAVAAAKARGRNGFHS